MTPHRSDTMQRISRRKIVEGTRVPGIIKNMQFHYVNIDVYEDGMVNCWELVDLDGLKEKINTNWLVTQVPDGENLSIHGLGSYKIGSATWKYNQRSYFRHIKETVKQLNPDMENIYSISKREKNLLNQRRVSYSPQATEFYVKREMFYETSDGEGFTVFFKHDGKCFLVNLIVYMDGRFTCYTSDFELSYQVEEIESLFQNGTFFTDIEQPTTIILNHFAEVTFTETMYSVDSLEKYKELKDIYIKLNGGKTAFEKCREMHYEYLKDPNEYCRMKLKEFYEQIPKHERMYLGDMDTKDSDYVRIIYHPERKREV